MFEFHVPPELIMGEWGGGGGEAGRGKVRDTGGREVRLSRERKDRERDGGEERKDGKRREGGGEGGKERGRKRQRGREREKTEKRKRREGRRERGKIERERG